MLCESTYGNRLHPDDDYHERLKQIVESTAARGGSVIIPAFAVGRTQELLYIFRELFDSGRLKTIPIHVDSPMAIDTTDLYRKHREDHSLEMDNLEAQGIRPFTPRGVQFDRAVADSKALNAIHTPVVIISASGMATGGRVLHHLKRCLPDSRNTVLCEGFQAPGTLGHALQSGAKVVRIHKEEVPVLAHLESMENLSGHADYGEILRWLGRFPRPPQKVWLVHGEPGGAESLREKIAGQMHWPAEAAQYLQKVTL